LTVYLLRLRTVDARYNAIANHYLLCSYMLDARTLKVCALCYAIGVQVFTLDNVIRLFLGAYRYPVLYI